MGSNKIKLSIKRTRVASRGESGEKKPPTPGEIVRPKILVPAGPTGAP
jgi:hypothetical protein